MQLRGQSQAHTHRNSLQQSLPTPISLCRCLSPGRLSDYCVGLGREQWIHSSLGNLQQPIWLSSPISHPAHQPLVLRIRRVRRGGGGGTQHVNKTMAASLRAVTTHLKARWWSSLCLLLGWSSKPPWTLHNRREPWKCTWHSHSGAWHEACWGADVVGGFENAQRLNTLRVKPDGIKEVLFVLLGAVWRQRTTGWHWWWWSCLPTARWR